MVATMTGGSTLRSVLLSCLALSAVTALSRQDQVLGLDQSQQDIIVDLAGRRDCWSPEKLAAAKPANLSSSERDLLEHICWNDELESAVHAPSPRRGVPEGLDCEVTKW